MQDLYQWTAGRTEWADLRAALANGKQKLNGTLNGSLDAFVEQQPEEARARWRALLAAYRADHRNHAPWEPSEGVRGRKDPVGRTIRRVYVDTDEFLVYCAEDEAEDDICTVRYLFKSGVSNEQAKRMRAGLCPIAAQIARLTDSVSSMSSRFDGRRQRRERERAFELMARAMAFGFEGQHDQARTVLGELETEINLRRDSKNRMRYIFATTLSFLTIAAAGIILKNGELQLFGPPLGTDESQTLVVNVLLFGALGAFFSVVYDIRSVRVHHAITIPEMIYAGAVRIPVGVIAAAVVILLITGQWLLGGLGDEPRSWSLLLLGFLAGFSEMFVPNALKNVEERATVAPPGTQGGATVSPAGG